ncbi:ArnT family glycosyltransferase [Chthonomonas calidirosea]|uniref:ArnT family glycosyltransferase n=1 Tax=Chthonomonas calidirosea TaxID=454171 RepID=UPI0006EC8F7F|nr:glycosyltransferase family 39 protein [Chthonomonas calidirosea]CEK15775.1 PMT family glycosyltransferase, 4-amino-4-deoxy-L-arabinose transferase [Chthonomonas calidirosea]
MEVEEPVGAEALPSGKKASVLGLSWETIRAVGFITLLGFLLRLFGITWSLPNAHHPFATYHPDELINLSAALQADIPHLKLDIGFYNYGTFYFYLVSLAETIAAGYGLLPSPQTPNAAHQAALFLVGRLVTVLMGTLTIPVVFALGRRLYGARIGWWAGLFYAVAPLAVVYGHFLAVDVPANLFVALALLWSARLVESDSARDGLLAGIWVGLAAATKYTAGVVIVAPLIALCWAKSPHRLRTAVLVGLGVLLAFFVGCPGPLVNWNIFWNGLPGYPGSGVYYELFVHSRQGHGLLFAHTGPGWWYHLIISFPWGLGLPLYAAALWGVGVAGRRRTIGDRLLLLFTALYFLIIGFSAVRFARYTLPLFIPLAVLTARGLEEVHGNRARERLQQGLLTVVALLTLLLSVGWVRRMVAPTPQDRAAAYLWHVLPPGASVAFPTIPWFYSPPLSPLFGLPSPVQRAKAAQEDTRFRLRIPSREWDRSVLSPLPDAVVFSNFETMHPLRLALPSARRFLAALPRDYKRVYFGSGPPLGAPPWQTIIPDDFLYVCPKVTVCIAPKYASAPE